MVMGDYGAKYRCEEVRGQMRAWSMEQRRWWPAPNPNRTYLSRVTCVACVCAMCVSRRHQVVSSTIEPNVCVEERRRSGEVLSALALARLLNF